MLKRNFNLLAIAVVLVLLFVFSCYLLLDPDYYIYLDDQIKLNYEVVFIDPSYLTFIAAVISLPFVFVSLVISGLFREKGAFPNYAKKAHVLTGVVVLLGVIMNFPGRSIESMRLGEVAEASGYIACPPFTLLSSTRTVDAYAKKLSYCYDADMAKIAKYGYRNELIDLNEFISRIENED